MSQAHILAAHFAVALALVSAGAEILAVVVRRPEVRSFGPACLYLAAGAALLSFFTGSAAAGWALARDPARFERVAAHENVGAVAVWVIAGAAVLRLALGRTVRDAARAVLVLPALLASVVAILAERSGYVIAHGLDAPAVTVAPVRAVRGVSGEAAENAVRSADR